MDLTPKSGKSTAGAVGGEKGQGDAKDKPNLKKGKAKAQSSADGTAGKGPLKELQGKMGACSLETAGEESQAKRRAAWKEEVKKELEKRAEYKRKMGAVPIEQVTKWKDKQAMSKMSTEWREGFKKERTSFLFNEVFPILLKTPKIYTKPDVLMCRRATKSWKETIDHCLSTTLESFSPYRTKSGYLEYYYFPMYINWFCTSLHVANFNRWAEAVSGLLENPFLSRKLFTGSLSDCPDREYWREMDKLVQRWGREIWVVEMFLPTGTGMEMIYEMLVKYLTLLPNLRAMKIIDMNHDSMIKVEELRERDLGKDVFGPLKELMSRKPLPELPNLREADLAQFLPDPIISAILSKYRGSLKTVQLKRPDLDNGEIPAGRDNCGPKMKQFYLSSLMSHSTFDLPLLEDMALEGYKVEGPEDVISLFKTLNGCGSKLRRLDLGMEFRIEIFEIMSGSGPDHFLTKPIRLELPLLERIMIDVTYTDLRNMDFLLELKSLKELDLRYHMLAPKHVIIKNIAAFSTRASSKGATIQFAGYEERLHKSNIWKLLPKLKLISITITRVIPQLTDHAAKGIIMKMDAKFKVMVTYTRDGGKCRKVTNYM